MSCFTPFFVQSLLTPQAIVQFRTQLGHFCQAWCLQDGAPVVRPKLTASLLYNMDERSHRYRNPTGCEIGEKLKTSLQAVGQVQHGPDVTAHAEALLPQLVQLQDKLWGT